MNEKIARHVFVFNRKDNGGEQLFMTTDLYNNGDGATGYYLNQTITLQSYCNSASFNLSGCQITPESLRQLANELESFLIKNKEK